MKDEFLLNQLIVVSNEALDIRAQHRARELLAIYHAQGESLSDAQKEEAEKLAREHGRSYNKFPGA